MRTRSISDPSDTVHFAYDNPPPVAYHAILRTTSLDLAQGSHVGYLLMILFFKPVFIAWRLGMESFERNNECL